MAVNLPSVDSVARVVAQGPAGFAAARHRLDALRSAANDAVAIPSALELTADGEVVAHTPRVRGVDLATLMRMREGLTAGECVAVGTVIARGLAALHERGIVHGDVAPANIVVSGRGAVLIDAMAGAGVGERGTPGYAAPERALAATAAGDVYALGRVLEHVADAAALVRVEAWTAHLTRPTPSERPSAVECSRALARCAPAEPVRVPALGVAASVRASAREALAATVKEPSGRAWRVRMALTPWRRLARVWRWRRAASATVARP